MKKVAHDCQLPLEMLDIISQNLDFDDLFQFAGVCKNWREFHKIYSKNFLASQAPLIFQSSSYAKNDYSFYSIPDQRTYRLKMGSLWGYSYAGSSSGYLIMAGANDTLLLINPFKRRKKVIDTSALRGKFSNSGCHASLAFSKGSKEFVIVASCTYYNSLHVYQSQNFGWVTYSVGGNPWNVVDFVVLHNTILVITDKADIGVLGVNSTNIKFLELKNAPTKTFSRLRLVSCNEQLLVVHFAPDKVLDVYKIDFATMNYVKLKTLGDTAFFYSSWTNCQALSNPGRWGYERNSMYSICLFAECQVYSGDDNKLQKCIVPSGSLQPPSRSSFYWLDWCFPHLHDEIIGVISTVLIFGSIAECRVPSSYRSNSLDYTAINCRKHSAILTDFGAVGDGKTLNTKAFNSAITKLSQYANDGGALLIVPPGKWLTGSFNLTSHFTLFLQKDAIILASQDEADWPQLPVLPSYGRGRDAPAGRFSSLIFGTNLTDVIITGNNGTIDGQGSVWWEKFKNDQLKLTRPYLIELMYSDQLQISNLNLINSPYWFIHPIYSSNIIINGLTIRAPLDVPNTDGINPDSSTNVRIEDNYIESGDDCIAIKSGWDEYGIKFGKPSQHIVIRRLTCISPKSAMIALGSEMSGGIQDIRVEDLTAINTESAIRIKSAVGRGGFVKDIFVKGLNLNTMKYVFWMTGSYGDHPDDKFDPKALPNVTGINYRDVTAKNVTIAGKLEGISNDPFTGICISNATIEMFVKKDVADVEMGVHKVKLPWNCTDVSGVTSNVVPQPCELLPEKKVDCPFPTDKLPIESVQFKTCSI